MNLRGGLSSLEKTMVSVLHNERELQLRGDICLNLQQFRLVINGNIVNSYKLIKMKEYVVILMLMLKSPLSVGTF